MITVTILEIISLGILIFSIVLLYYFEISFDIIFYCIFSIISSIIINIYVMTYDPCAKYDDNDFSSGFMSLFIIIVVIFTISFITMDLL